MSEESRAGLSRRTILGGLAAAAGAAVGGNLAAPAQAAPGADATPVRFHPGHYFWNPSRYWSAEQQRSDFAALDQVADNPYIKGIKIGFNWYFYESALGDYRQGIDIVGAYLDKLASLPTRKHLMISLGDRTFGKYDGQAYPDYVWSNDWVARAPAGTAGGLTTVPKMWTAPVMDRLIALSQALAVQFKNDPRLTMVSIGETSLSLPADTGFVFTDYYRQFVRWYTESKTAWPSTALRLFANYIRNDGWMGNLIQECVNAPEPGGLAVGGPDPELPLPGPVTRSIAANRVFRGETQYCPDLRGKVPWVGEIQQLGLKAPHLTKPVDIFNYYYDVMHANYIVWLRNLDRSVGGDEQQWNRGILPFINSIQGKIHTELPTIGSWV